MHGRSIGRHLILRIVVGKKRLQWLPARTFENDKTPLKSRPETIFEACCHVKPSCNLHIT
ncbi:hypothetical protein OCAR_4914 [Afipia carboxidovorans OM5]|nr:hypothetical protein OCAR_4914 [Afipia carboxidovorans OM5]